MSQFYNAISHGLCKLMVMGCKQYGSFEIFKGIVEGGYTFQIQMIGGLIQHEYIGS